MPAARVHDLTQQTTPVDPYSASNTGSPYQRLLYSLHHDQKWLTELNLGKRVGFYRFRGDLGSGNFSQVKMAIHQLTKEQVAIKILDKSKLDQKTRRMLAREISTMEVIHHPNIIRLYEVVETYSKIHLVMEYARGGELFNKITTAGRFTEHEAKNLFAQVISAVEYMHDHNFIHRDIKAENVFYSGPGLVKLGDFGFSTQLTTGRDQQLNTFCGSPPYAAPELFRDESYLGAPVDVWALGVLLYFLVTAQMPFKAQTVATLKKHILDGVYAVPAHVSPSCRKLIEGILKQAPGERLTIAQIRNSEWMRGVNIPERPGLAEEYSLVPTIIPKSPSSHQQDFAGRRESFNQSVLSRKGSLTIENFESLSSTVDEQEVLRGGITELETTARLRLAELGITADMLEESVPRGVRSAVIGMYRIMVHRLQRRGSAEREAHTPDSPQSTTHSTSLPATNHFCLSSLGRRTKSAAVKTKHGSKVNKNNRSRTCTIL